MSDKLSIKLIHTGTLSVPDGSIGTGSTHIPPKNIEWYQGPEDRDITVICNEQMLNKEFVSSIKGIKIAWLCSEPEEYCPLLKSVDIIKEYFDCVLVRSSVLVDNKKIFFCPTIGHWINDKAIYPKTKNISIIASGKCDLEGHRLRHHVVSFYRPYLDFVGGHGYKPIQDKLEGLKDYRFHVTIENVRRDFEFTEKLIDSFVTGCLPVYWGCPSIGNFFDERGMIIVEKLQHFEIAFKEYCNESYYKSCLPYIVKNFETAMDEYLTPEDYMFNHVLKDRI